MRRNLLPLFLLLSLGSSGLCWAESAAESATTDSRARELYENGAILYDEGRYEEAILAWEESYKLSGRSTLLFNIANAQERLGRWRDALSTLNRYRVYAKAEERDSLNRRITSIEDRLRESERQAAATPVAPAQPVPGPAETPPAATTTTTPSSTPSTEPPKPVDPPVQPPPESKSRWPSYALYATGAAALGTGTAFAFMARNARDEAGALCVSLSTGETLCPSEASEPLQRDRLDSIIADAGFAVGGLAVIGATVLLFVDTGPAPLSLRPTPTGILLGGRF